MNKKLFFAVAAVAVVCGSMAFNISASSSKSSSVKLSDVVQSADATLYYTNACTDPFIANGAWTPTQGVWYKVRNQDIPCDNTTTQFTVCMFGGSKTCPLNSNVGNWYVGDDNDPRLTIDKTSNYYNVKATGVDEDGEDWVLYGNK